MALPSISVSGGSWPGISSSLGEFGVLSTISCPVASCACAVCSFAMGCRRLTERETLGAGFQGGWLGCALCFCGRMGLVCLLLELICLWFCLSGLKAFSECVVRFGGGESYGEGDLRLLMQLSA